MRVPDKYYDEIFEFTGQWDIFSKCGLKLVNKDNKNYIIVTELYQDNPGSSVTATGYSLAKQICEKKGFSIDDINYIECNPDTNSKLSFYDEEFFAVSFSETSGMTGRPSYRQLTREEVDNLFSIT
jgi:hypothetical protein